MLQFEAIEIRHKEIMQSFLSEDLMSATERNFTCLYIWAPHYSTQVCITEKNCFIRMKGKEDEHFSYYPPLGSGDLAQAITAIFELEGRTQIDFFGLTPIQALEFEQILGDRVEISNNLDIADYLYKSQDLMTLVGKKFSAKRNHVNKFLKLYGDTFEYRAIDFEKDVDYLMDFHRQWCIGKDSENLDAYQHEFCAIKRAAKHASALDLRGGMLTVAGDIVAYTIGAPINEITFDVLFEKGDIAIEGAYAMINQQFAQKNYADFEFINREEDLGIPGLRKAKQSYNPVMLIEKFNAAVKL